MWLTCFSSWCYTKIGTKVVFCFETHKTKNRYFMMMVPVFICLGCKKSILIGAEHARDILFGAHPFRRCQGHHGAYRTGRALLESEEGVLHQHSLFRHRQGQRLPVPRSGQEGRQEEKNRERPNNEIFEYLLRGHPPGDGSAYQRHRRIIKITRYYSFFVSHCFSK